MHPWKTPFLLFSAADEHLAELMPIFEQLRAQGNLPCTYPLHVTSSGTAFMRGTGSRSTPLSPHAPHCHPSTHWVSVPVFSVVQFPPKSRFSTLCDVFFFSYGGAMFSPTPLECDLKRRSCVQLRFESWLWWQWRHPPPPHHVVTHLSHFLEFFVVACYDFSEP